MYSEQVEKELKKGWIVMALVFVWGLLIMFVISALINRMWLWYLSVVFIPIIAFLVGLLYDVYHDFTPFTFPEPKKVWEELSEPHITIIKEYKDSVAKRYSVLN